MSKEGFQWNIIKKKGIPMGCKTIFHFHFLTQNKTLYFKASQSMLILSEGKTGRSGMTKTNAMYYEQQFKGKILLI